MGKIRDLVAGYSYRKDAAGLSHPRILTNFADAKQVGILYVVNDVPDFEVVEAFVGRLQKEHKEVKALGFVRNKNLIGRFLPRLSYDFFSRRDLTWYNKPIHEKVKDFIAKEFDILIDLSLQDFFPMKYISGLSKAKCRVGRYTEANTDYYDLMLDAKPGITAEAFIEQIYHYLSIINRNEKGS